MDESTKMFEEQEMLANFLACFYVDGVGNIDISWDKFVPFATLYQQLTTNKSILLGDTLRIAPDQARLVMVWAVLVGMYDKTISWSIGEGGKLLISSIDLVEDPHNYLKHADTVLHTSRQINNAFFAKYYPHESTPTRKMLSAVYSSYMDEMTHMHNIIHKLIWRVSQMQID